MSIPTSTIKGLEHHSRLRENWVRLLPKGRWSAFLHPDWCHALWRSYYPTSRVVFHIAGGEDDVMGLLPTCHRRMNRFGLFLPISEAFVGERGDYSFPVLKDYGSDDVLEALLNSAVSESRSTGTLVLGNVPEVHEMVPRIRGFLQRAGATFVERPGLCRTILLDQDLETVEARFSKSLRSDLRRQERRLAADVGPPVFRVIIEKEEARERLPDLFAMHDKRWISSGLPGTFSEPGPRGFYEGLIEDFWDSGVHFSMLECGGKPVAFHFGFISGAYLLYYKPAFEWDLQNYSPGKVHLRYLLAHGIERGWKGVDLLQGEDQYKRSWSSDLIHTTSFIIKTSQLSPGYWWITEGRAPVQRALGSTYNRLAAWIGSIRQR